MGIELSSTAADAGAGHRHEGRWGPRRGLPIIMTGAQPILPPGFSAYADVDR